MDEDGCEFIVAIDTFLTATARYADVGAQGFAAAMVRASFTMVSTGTPVVALAHWGDLKDALAEADVRTIVIDPRYSETAANCADVLASRAPYI